MPTTNNKRDSIARKYLHTDSKKKRYILLYRRSGHCAGLSTVTFNGFYDTSKNESNH